MDVFVRITFSVTNIEWRRGGGQVDNGLVFHIKAQK